MKPFLSIIRWKFVLPVALVVSAIVVFFIFFFDPIAERVIEKVGSRLNEAKVEVDGFKTKFFQGRVLINRLQVTDNEAPMTNAVDAGPLAFQMDLSEIISKRVIINEATLSGLKFGTLRKTSGALPSPLVRIQEKEEPSAAAKLAEKYQNQFKLNLDGMKSDAKSKIEFNVDDLELTKLANELKEMANDLPVQWEKSIADLNAENRLKKIEDDLKSIKSTPIKGVEALTAIPEALKKLKQSKDDLDQLKKDVQEIKQTAANQLQDIKNVPKALAQAKKKDVDDLMSRFNLDFANPERLVEGMLGPILLRRIQQAMHYVDLAKKHMPSQKEKDSLPPKPRFKGIDIPFPTAAALPRFWLMKAALDGQFGDVGVAGNLAHLTTNPTRVGKPFQLALDGQKGEQDFSLQAVFDHVGDNNKDSLALQAKGLDVSSWVADTVPYLSGGGADLSLVMSLIDLNNLGGDIQFSFKDLKFNDSELLKQVGLTAAATQSKTDQLKMRFMTDVARAIEKAPQVEVVAQVYGTWADPSLRVSSNLASLLNDVIKKSVGSLVQDQRKELEAKLDSIIKEKTADVQAKLGPLEEKLGQFGGLEKKIQEKINEATGISLVPSGDGAGPLPGVKIPDLKKLFKK